MLSIPTDYIIYFSEGEVYQGSTTNQFIWYKSYKSPALHGISWGLSGDLSKNIMAIPVS
jgi:hypothetical protein